MHLHKHREVGVIILITLLFLLVRLVALEQVYMLHDERDIVYSGLSLARTGGDLYGRFFPFSFTGISPDNPLVSIWISAIGWIFTPVPTVFSARLPFVLIATSLPALFYLIIKQMTHDTHLAIFGTLIASFSPWMLHLTRYAMDITTALPILLVAILYQLKKRHYLAYVLYVLSFYNYQGFRIAIPVVILAVEMFHGLPRQFNQWRVMLRHTIFIILLCTSILVIDRSVTVARSNQIVFLNREKFSSLVDEKRRVTRAPLSVSSLFDNKLAENIHYTIEGLVNGMNLDLFFVRGDTSATNGTGIGGLFLVITLPLFIVGVMNLASAPKGVRYLATFILIGMLPAIASLNGHTYGIRGSLMIIGYAVIMAYGVTVIIHRLPSPNWKIVICGAYILILSLEFVVFGYNYFFRRPILLGEMYNERERTLVKDITQSDVARDIVVYDNEPKDLLISYLFLTSATMDTVHRAMRGSQSHIYCSQNVCFRDCDVDWRSRSNQSTVYVSNRCLKDIEYNELSMQHLRTIGYIDTPLTAFFIVPPSSR